MIISGGVNIYPQETENVLINHPDVADVAVFGVPNEEMGEEVKAVVQHGASTLPKEAFNEFSKADAIEVHLAAGFQNLIFDQPALPANLKEQVYTWLREHRQEERKVPLVGDGSAPRAVLSSGAVPLVPELAGAVTVLELSRFVSIRNSIVRPFGHTYNAE